MKWKRLHSYQLRGLGVGGGGGYRGEEVHWLSPPLLDP